MKTKKNKNQEPNVLISKTQHLVRRSNKVPPGEYNGPESHFVIDYNTEEALLQAIWNYAVKNDEAKLIEEVNILKQNLYLLNSNLKTEAK